MTDVDANPYESAGSAPAWANQPAPVAQMPVAAPPPYSAAPSAPAHYVPPSAQTPLAQQHLGGPMQPTIATPPTQAMPQAAHATAQVGNGKIIAAYVCAVLSIIVLPIILGPVAIGLAGSAAKAGHPGGKTARAVACGCMLTGMILGALVATRLS